MTKNRILDLASKSDGLLIQFTDLVRELIDECKITAMPVGDGWTIIRIAPPPRDRLLYRKRRPMRPAMAGAIT